MQEIWMVKYEKVYDGEILCTEAFAFADEATARETMRTLIDEQRDDFDFDECYIDEDKKSFSITPSAGFYDQEHFYVEMYDTIIYPCVPKKFIKWRTEEAKQWKEWEKMNVGLKYKV